MIDRNYPALSRAISASLLWAFVTTVADATERAWTTSASRRAIVRAGDGWDVRTFALLAAIACSVSLAAQALIPAYVRSGLPVFWPLLLIALLVAIAVWPAVFQRAWTGSTVARLIKVRPFDR